ncbi:MAG: amidohydrolase family protein [Pseudomonadales bacterium]|nr:amidohydrolase family protein [Pseudomonadales bacterium]
MAKPGSAEWLASVKENIIDPDQRILDPHHHLWRKSFLGTYLVDDLWKDTGSGHNVVKTVFVECGAEYRKDGPEHLKPLGETEFVVSQAKLTETGEGSEIAAIVSHADLSLGDAVEEVLQGHADLGNGKFRGIRDAGAHSRHPGVLMIPGGAPADLYAQTEFRAGMRRLGKMGFSYDTWHYHYQNQDFIALAQACPETQMILDHFGTPIGVGPYADKREEVFEEWKADMQALAKCENVVVKLGGLAMPDNGFGWNERAEPPGSDEFVDAQKAHYLHMIDCFGPDRCMFESNFPVDKMSLSYHVLFNGLKKIVADFSSADKDALFYGTAARVYKVED